MESFNFFFGLYLGRKLYGLNDNLSKTLQKMSAISGQRFGSLTVKILEKMRSNRDFDLFYELILKKASAISGIRKPKLPRRRSQVNCSLLQYFGDRKEASNSANVYLPSSAHQQKERRKNDYKKNASQLPTIKSINEKYVD